jgi:protein SSD1
MSPSVAMEVSLNIRDTLTSSIPDREYEIRNDLRGERVFTIDPHTTKDLDDALSIKANDDGTYTVGVHIADVSYFREIRICLPMYALTIIVKSNTAMDRDARKRATSVYLVQRAVPMLPPQLSEQLCSLQPDVDRLTFSASFVLDNEANVLEKDFSRSIIKQGVRTFWEAPLIISDRVLNLLMRMRKPCWRTNHYKLAGSVQHIRSQRSREIFELFT